MRFCLSFKGDKFKEGNINYRPSFISFMKKVFGETPIFSELFEDKKFKPYVFSIYLGEGFSNGRQIGPLISLIFSTGSPHILMNFWNGILSLKMKGEDFVEIGGNKFYLEDIRLERNFKIGSQRILCRSIGIIVLTDPEACARDFNKWYLVPSEDNLMRFNKALKMRVMQKWEFIKRERFPESDIRFSPAKISDLDLSLEDDFPLIKETIVPHYEGYVKGFRGYFWLEAREDVLQFLYDFGLGVRTGQGFGLFKVIKQV